jgi:tRNA A37 N6-isopentenylltransferase MiaA
VRDAIARGADPRTARDAVIVATRQYAKRQRTWIRHQLAPSDVTHVDPESPDAAERIEAWWEGASVNASHGGVEVGR